MKKGKRGFTLIEVAIFLAVTGALFVAVVAGVQNSIYQQRKNDSVQSFVEFLRGAYAGVTNVQNEAQRGKTENAIYGKLVVFGERNNLAGVDSNDLNTIYEYSVVGKVNSGTGSALDLLDQLDSSVVIEKTEDSRRSLAFAGYPESFVPKWAAQIEPACTSVGDGCYEPLKAMLLIMRHPSSGTVYTYYTDADTFRRYSQNYGRNIDSVLQINQKVATVNSQLGSGMDVPNARKLFEFSKVGFQTNVDVNFCVNTEDGENAYGRVNVRIPSGARNSSGIEIVPDQESACRPS